MGHETAAWDCELAPKINAKDSARPGARSFCGTASPPSGASVKPQLRRPCRLLIPARPVIHLAAAALATLHPRPKPRDRRVIRIAPDVGRSRTRPVRRPCRGRSHRIQSELAPTWGVGWTGGFARRGICTGSSGVWPRGTGANVLTVQAQDTRSSTPFLREFGFPWPRHPHPLARASSFG
jgi:hypothetical protein